MAASVTVLWLVAAFLGGAFSLSCYHCITKGEICEDTEKPCEAGHDACITTLTEIRQEDKGAQSKLLQKQLVKSCGEKQYCNQTYSMSFGSTKLYAATKCCESDKCKVPLPEVKTQDKETQQKCSNCAGLIEKCVEAETTSCFGTQNKCVTFTSKNASIPNVVYTWKGCVTDNVCSMKTIPTLPMSHMLAEKPACHGHAPSLLPGMLAPMAFGLALLKLLL